MCARGERRTSRAVTLVKLTKFCRPSNIFSAPPNASGTASALAPSADDGANSDSGRKYSYRRHCAASRATNRFDTRAAQNARTSAGRPALRACARDARRARRGRRSVAQLNDKNKRSNT